MCMVNYLRGSTVLNTSARERRRTGPFIRTNEDHTFTIDKRKPICRNPEASERVHCRHIWQRLNLVILSWGERPIYPSFPLNRVRVEDDPRISSQWRSTDVSEPGCEYSSN